MGTVVVESPLYESLLAEVAGLGYTKDDLRVSLVYGKKFNPHSISDPTISEWASWHIRGISDIVPLP